MYATTKSLLSCRKGQEEFKFIALIIIIIILVVFYLWITGGFN